MPIEKQQATNTKRNETKNKQRERYPYELLNRFGAWGAFLYLTAGPNNILIGDVLFVLLLLLLFVVFRRRPLILSLLS